MSISSSHQKVDRLEGDLKLIFQFSNLKEHIMQKKLIALKSDYTKPAFAGALACSPGLAVGAVAGSAHAAPAFAWAQQHSFNQAFGPPTKSGFFYEKKQENSCFLLFLRRYLFIIFIYCESNIIIFDKIS